MQLLSFIRQDVGDALGVPLAQTALLGSHRILITAVAEDVIGGR
jgi:hypothetical protein